MTGMVNVDTAALVLGALSLFGLLIKQLGPLRQDLFKRIQKLEDDLKLERVRCDAELRTMRHRNNGSRQIIYSLLHLFDLPAARRKEMLANVRLELANLEQAEAIETGLALTAILEKDARAE